MRQRDCVCLTEALIIAGGLHTKRLESVAVRKDRRLFIRRSRTVMCHWSGSGVIAR